MLFGLQFGWSTAEIHAQLEINSPTTWTTNQEFTQSVEVSAPLTISGDLVVGFQYADLSGDSIGDLYFSIEPGGEIIIEPGSSLLLTRAGAVVGTPEHHWRGLILNASNTQLSGIITIKYAVYGLWVSGSNNSIYNMSIDSTNAVRIESTANNTFFKYMSISNVIAGDAGLNINADNTSIDYLRINNVAETALDIDATVDSTFISNMEIDNAQLGIDNRGYLVMDNVLVDNSSTYGIVNTGILGAENLTISNSTLSGFQTLLNSVSLLTLSAFTDNGSAGVEIGSSSSTVIINSSNIFDNDGADSLYVQSVANGSITADLTGNWWGRSTNINRFIDEAVPGSIDFTGWVTSVIATAGYTPLASVTRTISFTNLQDNDRIVTDEPYILEWTTTGEIPFVDIDIEGITGNPSDVVELSNTGIYTFTLPTGEFTGAANDGSITITQNAGVATASVDNLNETTGIGLNTNLTGNFYFGRDTVEIRWLPPSDWTNILLQYNADVANDPDAYTNQALIPADTGVYQWIIPNTGTGALSGTPGFPTAQGRIRLVNAAEPTVGADSSGLFTISPRPNIESGELWEPRSSSVSMTVTVNDVDFIGDTNADGIVDVNESLLSTANEVIWVGAFFINASSQYQLAGYAVIDTDGGTGGVQNNFTDDRIDLVADDVDADPVTITVFGDDATTPLEQEGPASGDELIFYAWRTAWNTDDNRSFLDENTYLLDELDAVGASASRITFADGATPTIQQLRYDRQVNTDNFRPPFEAQVIELPTSGGWTQISSYIIPGDNSFSYNNAASGTSILSGAGQTDLSTVSPGFPVLDPDGAGALTQDDYQGILHNFASAGSGNGTAGFEDDDDFIMIKDGRGNVYWNLDQAANTAVEVDQLNNSWDYLQGYLINTTALANATAIRFVGPRVVPEQTRIPLREGWNLVPYFRRDPIDIRVGLSDATDIIEIVKDQDGRVYWPTFAISSLGNLEPGKAYWVYSLAAGSFRYPANSFTGKIASTTKDSNRAPSPNARKSSNFMILRLEWAEEHPLLQAGNMVEVLNKHQQIVGEATIQEDQSATFHLIGKDDFSGNHGLESKEEMQFRIISEDAKSMKPIYFIETQTRNPIAFKSYGLEVYEVNVDERGEGNLLPTETLLMQNYPNPFNPNTTIRFDLAQRSRVQLEVYDISGRLVVELTNRIYEAGRHEVSLDASNWSSGLYIYRMRSNRGVQTRRMTLLK